MLGTIKRLLSGSPRRVPDWASFFTQRQLNRFVSLIDGHFDRVGKNVAIDLDAGIARADEGGEEQSLGLQNLAQLCAASESADWPKLVDQHFESLRRSRIERTELEAIADEFSRVQRQLVLRLVAIDNAEDFGESVIARETMPGIIAAVFFDLPSSYVTVDRGYLTRWGRSEEEILDLALENVFNSDTPAIETHVVDGVELRLVTSDSFLTSSHALLLERYKGLVGEGGALVAVPTRHVVIVHPVDGEHALVALELMAPAASNLFAEGPGSVSPRLNWLHEGEFSPIPFSLEDGVLEIRPPRALLDIIDELEGEEKTPTSHESLEAW